MPDLSTLGLFAIACLALTATPGPDMLLIASRSASQGRTAGFATYLGIATGTYCHALAAAFGLSQRPGHPDRKPHRRRPVEAHAVPARAADSARHRLCRTRGPAGFWQPALKAG
jgi:hypothetical protein